MTAEEYKHVWTSGRVLFGIVLTFAFCFLAIATATYSPLDPPSRSFIAPEQHVHNLCGVPGAVCADMLYRFCGYGVWLLLAAFFLRLVSFWRLPKPKGSILKVIGTLLMLTAFSGALSSFATSYTPKPQGAPVTDTDTARGDAKESPLLRRLAAQQTELGPGGELGAAARFVLDKKLSIAPAGIAVFFLFMFAAGVILVSDSRLLHFLLQVTGFRAIAEIFVSPDKKEKGGEKGEDDGEEPHVTLHKRSKQSPRPRPVLVDGGDGTNGDAGADEPIPDRSTVDDKQRFDTKSAPPMPYMLPPIDILPYADPIDRAGFNRRIADEMRRLQRAFDDYACDVRVIGYQSGPVITLFELELSKGQKLAQIQSLSNELAIAMKVPSVRIVFPIPGKSSVGVEIPNKDRQLVRLRNVMEAGAETAERMQIPLFIGEDVTGDPIIADLAALPHLLIAGRTGTGKSVCLNSIILSILMTKTPAQIRLVLIDPKMVELSPYKQIPHLLHPVLTDMKRAAAVLNWLCDKMDERYNLLARVGVRQLREYNRLSIERLRQRYQPETDQEWEQIPKKLPAIVVIADEMADMMAIAGKDVQEFVARLAQKSRAVGIHLILATQKPTVDVVTGLIKSNLPARIAFGVATQSDSRVILDNNGAEKLLGNGDLLFLDSVTNQIIRGQGTYIDDDEIFSVNSEISVAKPDFATIIDSEDPEREFKIRQSDDPLYEKAVNLVVSERRGSTSLLQRRFSIGYGRAAKIIDAMEADGIIGPKTENDSKPRKVLISLEEWNARKAADEGEKVLIPHPFLPTPEFYRPDPPAYRDPPSQEAPRSASHKGREELDNDEPYDEDEFEEDWTDEEYEDEMSYTDEEGEYDEETEYDGEESYDDDEEESYIDDEEYEVGSDDEPHEDSGDDATIDGAPNPAPVPRERPRPDLRELARRRKERRRTERDGEEGEGTR